MRHHQVGSLPYIFYIPDYLTAAEDDSLASTIRTSKQRWTQVSGRRLRNYGGRVHEKTGVLLAAPLPGWLQALLRRLQSDTGIHGAGGEAPNHVLLNAYLPGQGILPHQDGPLYYPGVCILSLGGPAVLRFRRKISGGIAAEAAASVLLMPRSLVAFAGAAYSDHLHGIEEVEAEAIDASIVNLDRHPELQLRTASRDLVQPPPHTHTLIVSVLFHRLQKGKGRDGHLLGELLISHNEWHIFPYVP
ncbi:hypothetical protein WJX81_003012 [Elliptochloris bilobata]|uniref:Fe2OG dioxygenase domain-containing protein n=1 Tax=Elliptochloris bilobata TaxID=381761 RepID=A0AAW1S0N7_9CHLO